MNSTLLESALRMGAVARGRVIRVATGELWVEVEGLGPIVCDVLKGPDGQLSGLEPGDPVLLTIPATGETRGCVLGVPTPYVPSRSEGRAEKAHHISGDEIILEAGRRLELRVGEARIVIREDGRVIIQGHDVVSRAKGVNRIRGAAVSIN